jgi:hypothetical protein
MLFQAHNLSATPVWQVNFNQTGETPVPKGLLADGNGCGGIGPEIGITGTPVIDLNGNYPDVLYAVTSTANASNVVTQRLNAVSIFDGSPTATALNIASAFSGFSGSPTFDATSENQRAALAVDHDSSGNPLIFVAWGGYCDLGTYRGLVAEFRGTATSSTPPMQLALVAIFDASGGVSGASQSGIWMGGAGPAVGAATSSSGDDVYFGTGNGTVSYGSSLSASALGESVLRVHSTQTGSSFTFDPIGAYTANEWSILNIGNGPGCAHTLTLPPPYASGSFYCSGSDMDLDAGGLILAQATGSILPSGDNFVVLEGGKEGVVYDLDPSNMSNTGPDTAAPCTTGSGGQTLQCFGAVRLLNANVNSPQNDATGVRCSSAFWPGNSSTSENILYEAGSGDNKMWGYQMGSGAIFGVSSPLGSYSFSGALGYSGSCPVVTWDSSGGSTAAADAVLWVMVDDASSGSPSAVKLQAFTALPTGGLFSAPLFSDTSNGPAAVPFAEPTVVDGYVFAAGQVHGSSFCATLNGCYGMVTSWH